MAPKKPTKKASNDSDNDGEKQGKGKKAATTIKPNTEVVKKGRVEKNKKQGSSPTVILNPTGKGLKAVFATNSVKAVPKKNSFSDKSLAREIEKKKAELEELNTRQGDQKKRRTAGKSKRTRALKKLDDRDARVRRDAEKEVADCDANLADVGNDMIKTEKEIKVAQTDIKKLEDKREEQATRNSAPVQKGKASPVTKKCPPVKSKAQTQVPATKPKTGKTVLQAQTKDDSKKRKAADDQKVDETAAKKPKVASKAKQSKTDGTTGSKNNAAISQKPTKVAQGGEIKDNSVPPEFPTTPQRGPKEHAPVLLRRSRRNASVPPEFSPLGPVMKKSKAAQKLVSQEVLSPIQESPMTSSKPASSSKKVKILPAIPVVDVSAVEVPTTLKVKPVKTYTNAHDFWERNKEKKKALDEKKAQDAVEAEKAKKVGSQSPKNTKSPKPAPHAIPAPTTTSNSQEQGAKSTEINPFGWTAAGFGDPSNSKPAASPKQGKGKTTTSSAANNTKSPTSPSKAPKKKTPPPSPPKSKPGNSKLKTPPPEFDETEELKGLTNWSNACFSNAAIQFIDAVLTGLGKYIPLNQYLGADPQNLAEFNFTDANCKEVDKKSNLLSFDQCRNRVRKLQKSINDVVQDKHVANPSIVQHFRHLIHRLRAPLGPRERWISALRFQQVYSVMKRGRVPKSGEQCMDGSEQEDPVEYFEEILEKFAADTQVPEGEILPLLFEFMTQTREGCSDQSCSYPSSVTQDEPETVRKVPMINEGPSISIGDLMELPMLQDEMCPVCGSQLQKTKEFVQLPPRLVVHLVRSAEDQASAAKRAAAEAAGVEKRNLPPVDLVKVFREVDFSEEVNINGDLFFATAIVVHDGPTPRGGHYMILRYHKRKWWKIDDREVTEMHNLPVDGSGCGQLTRGQDSAGVAGGNGTLVYLQKVETKDNLAKKDSIVVK